MKSGFGNVVAVVHLDDLLVHGPCESIHVIVEFKHQNRGAVIWTGGIGGSLEVKSTCKLGPSQLLSPIIALTTNCELNTDLGQ